MSRWLGMKRREAQPAAPPDVGAALMAKHGRLVHRRKSSEETEQSSRRSSQQSQNGHNNNSSSSDRADEASAFNGGGGAMHADADAGTDAPSERDADSPGTGGSDSFGDDWEVLGDSGLHAGRDDGGGGDGRDEREEAERPLSPGVDFSSLYAYSAQERERDEEGEGGLVLGELETVSKWLDAGEIHSFLVRGPTYLQDKAKRPAGKAMCRLAGFDCFTEESAGATRATRVDHIASRGSCRERVQALTSGSGAPFLFIMNIQVRGTPTVSLVAYWEVDREALEEASINSTETLAASDEEALGTGDACVPTEGIEGEEHVSAEKAFFRIVASYANLPVSSFGGDGCDMMDEAPPLPYSDERNARFKLIPRVIGGPWMVRKAIGSTPVLLGTKITHRYYRGEGYFETDMDTGSSAAAASLCGRCRGLSRKIDVELGIVLQANSAEELPEALLGAVRLNGFGVEDPVLQRKLYPS